MSVSEITETRQYLTFKLGNEVFATDVAKVREVLDFTTITAIPQDARFHERRDQPAGQRGSGGRPAALLSRCRRPSGPGTPASWWWKCCWTTRPQ